MDDGSGALVAYDKANGDVLGQVDLPGRIVGTPMTYMVGGKQYIAVAIRVRRDGKLIALKLPE